MSRFLRACLLGFLIWVVPFAIAFGLYPLRQSQRPLFESIMPVVIGLCVMAGAAAHFARVSSGLVREGAGMGLLWATISIAFDLLFFVAGPLRMPLAEYVKDIAVTYLLIPIVTTGVGVILHERVKRGALASSVP
jgi:hypothetical protein